MAIVCGRLLLVAGGYLALVELGKRHLTRGLLASMG
jgi:hypothetical protein